MSNGHYALVNGRQMYYEEHGQGRPVVFLHGGLNSFQSSFEQLIPVFAQQHRVIGIDQVGHGRSPDSPGPFSYSQMADDTATLLRQLNIAEADFVGWSDGGIVGLILGCRHPDLVRRLVAAGANLRAEDLGHDAIKYFRDTPIDQLVGPREKWPEFYVTNSPDGPDHWPVVFRKGADLFLTPVYMEAAELAGIRAPTMVVSGDFEDMPFETTLEIFRSIPKAQLCILPGTNHMMTFRNPDNQFNAIMLAFIDAP